MDFVVTSQDNCGTFSTFELPIGGRSWLCCLNSKGGHTFPQHRHPKMELNLKLTSSTVLSISAKYSLLSPISFSSAWISCSFCFSSSCLAAISSSLSASRWSFSEVTFSSWNFLSNKECLKSEIAMNAPASRRSWVRFLPGTMKIFSVVPLPVTKQPSFKQYMIFFLFVCFVCYMHISVRGYTKMLSNRRQRERYSPKSKHHRNRITKSTFWSCRAACLAKGTVTLNQFKLTCAVHV